MFLGYSVKMRILPWGAGEMAQWLKVHAALAEDPSSILSTTR